MHLWSLSCVLSATSAAVTPVFTSTDHFLPVSGLAFGVGAGEDQRLYSVSLDHTLKMYDVPSKHLLLSVSFGSALRCLAVHPHDLCAYVGAEDTNIYRYRLSLVCLVLSCGPSYLILPCLNLFCRILSCPVLYCIALYCIALYCIVLYCIVLYCIVLYCTINDGSGVCECCVVVCASFLSAHPLSPLPPTHRSACSVDLSGVHLSTASSVSTAVGPEQASAAQRRLLVLSRHRAPVTCVALSSDGATLASCGTDAVLLWATASNTVLRKVADACGAYWAAFVPRAALYDESSAVGSARSAGELASERLFAEHTQHRPKGAARVTVPPLRKYPTQPVERILACLALLCGRMGVGGRENGAASASPA